MRERISYGPSLSPGFRSIDLSFSPIALLDAGLVQNLFEERFSNGCSAVWVGNANFQRSLLHELLASAGDRPDKSQAAEPLDQFAAGDRFQRQAAFTGKPIRPIFGIVSWSRILRISQSSRTS